MDVLVLLVAIDVILLYESGDIHHVAAVNHTRIRHAKRLKFPTSSV